MSFENSLLYRWSQSPELDLNYLKDEIAKEREPQAGKQELASMHVTSGPENAPPGIARSSNRQTIDWLGKQLTLTNEVEKLSAKQLAKIYGACLDIRAGLTDEIAAMTSNIPLLSRAWAMVEGFVLSRRLRRIGQKVFGLEKQLLSRKEAGALENTPTNCKFVKNVLSHLPAKKQEEFARQIVDGPLYVSLLANPTTDAQKDALKALAQVMSRRNIYQHVDVERFKNVSDAAKEIILEPMINDMKKRLHPVVGNFHVILRKRENYSQPWLSFVAEAIVRTTQSDATPDEVKKKSKALADKVSQAAEREVKVKLVEGKDVEIVRK